MNADKKTLLSISILFSVIGILLIYYASTRFEPEVVKISDISKGMMGETVRIRGKVIEADHHKKTLFMRLKDPSGEINAVKFDCEEKNLENKEIELLGEINLYEGDLEIIVENIKESKDL